MFEEIIAKKLTKYLLSEKNFDLNYQAKVEYGLAILLVNFFKLISIIMSAMLFFSVTSTLYCYIPYCIIRSNIFGYHAKNSLVCSLQSIVAFSVIPFFIQIGEYTINKFIQLIIIIPLVWLLLKFAPSVVKSKNVTTIKKRSICCVLILFTLSRTFSAVHSTISFYGIILVILMSLPKKFRREKYGK